MSRKIFAAVLAVMLFAGAVYARDIKLGSLTVKAPDSFVNGEVTSSDIAEGVTAYYKSAETLMDFDVYEFPKDEPFDEFVKSYASSNLTREEINGVKAAVYRSTDQHDGKEYSTLNYILEDGNEYVLVVFWLDGETAEAEALAIINSLSK